MLAGVLATPLISPICAQRLMPQDSCASSFFTPLWTIPKCLMIELFGILEAVLVKTVSLILVSNVIARSILLANLMVLG